MPDRLSLRTYLSKTGFSVGIKTTQLFLKFSVAMGLDSVCLGKLNLKKILQEQRTRSQRQPRVILRNLGSSSHLMTKAMEKHNAFT